MLQRCWGVNHQLLPWTVRDINFVLPLTAFTTSQCTKASIIIKSSYSVLNLALDGEVHYVMILPVCNILETVMDE